MEEPYTCTQCTPLYEMPDEYVLFLYWFEKITN